MECSPWKVVSAQVSVGVLTEGWNLSTIDPDDDGVRNFIVDIAFDVPFTYPPVVHLGLTGFDIDQRDSARLSVRAENITNSGFQATLVTWAHTRVFGADFQWIAIGG